MESFVNGGADDDRSVFRVDAVHDVESVSIVNGSVVVGDTATTAQVGDTFRAETGPLAGLEIPIIEVSTNSITIASSVAPDVADTFYILRRVTDRVDSSGAIVVTTSPDAIKFLKDAVITDVTEVTATPASNIPLPTKVMKADGTLVDFSTETTLSAVNAKLPALVSGRVPVDGSGVTQPVSAASLPLPTGAATEATLLDVETNTLDTKTAVIALSQKTASALVPEPFDYIIITYVGATTDIDTVVYKLGGAGGTLVATLTLGYDGSNRLSTVTRS